MKYYIKNWYSNLKNSKYVSTNDSTNVNGDSFHSDEATTSNDSFYELIQEPQERFHSVYLFLITSCFLLLYLSNYLVFNDKLSGLLFLLSTLIVLTCLIFYYPVYQLTISGYINLRILKWIYTILGCGVFFYLLRMHTQCCSSLIISASLGAKLFRELPFTFPNTFTYNELVLIVSMLANVSFTFIMNFSNIIPVEFDEVNIVQQALIWLLLTISCTTNIKFARSSLIGFLSCSLLILFVQFIPLSNYLVKQNPFLWLFDFLFINHSKRIYLLIYWTAAFFSLGLIILMQKQNVFYLESEKTNEKNSVLTSVRKLFHLLICIVYGLGFVHDKHLLYLCSYGMFILLILIETIRYHKIGKLSQIINDTMHMFVDEKDLNSKLILSHIYLLVGLSYPLWISNYNEFNLAQLSGLITVGIGDSFASLIGSRFGKHKLPGSNKSVEGSLALIFSEFLVILILNQFGLIDLFNLNNIVLIILFLIITCFVEAFTSDNDNFIMPIVAYPFLCLISV